ncbi:MAG TPA: isocitrate lyase/phosphoenolpyruvate mutase family protein [Xanthobacteraceae bacterium]|jgi:2-methylisocitrate lyase-like PEP mutase family enzyme|nr:isocitrate lyase/phosphoenolpyruvate mutase family protein [Xanthobacteraceae bacterium]
MSSIAEKRHAFRRLHETGCFVIPNPWDVGSAHFLQHLGFPALASTSSGFAYSRARPDGGLPLNTVLAHLHELVAMTDVPINADFEGGFARDPSGVTENVVRCVETGVAGLSIEDASGDKSDPLYDFDLCVERIRAARQAIDAEGGQVLLTGRSEGFLVGCPDLDETIRRLQAYSAAGADCLYAPGIRTPEQISAVVNAVAPKPVNLLIGSAIGLTVDQVARLGVRRISVGGALARAAWGGFARAAQLIASEGRFDGLIDALPGAELNDLFADNKHRHQE